MDQSYKKIDKLKGKKLIEKLFSEGKSLAVYPLRLVYLNTHFEDPVKLKTGVSVSKRNFKTAVARNRIKRLMREAYRLKKSSYISNMSGQYALMILYTGKTEIDSLTISKKMDALMNLFLKQQLPKR